MKFVKGDGGVTSIDSINDGLIIVIKTVQNFFNQVFMIKGFAKCGKFIRSSFDGLHVVSDGLRSFGDIFEMVFELFNMATSWSGIGIGENLPCFIRGLSLCYERD